MQLSLASSELSTPNGMRCNTPSTGHSKPPAPHVCQYLATLGAWHPRGRPPVARAVSSGMTGAAVARCTPWSLLPRPVPPPLRVLATPQEWLRGLSRTTPTLWSSWRVPGAPCRRAPSPSVVSEIARAARSPKCRPTPAVTESRREAAAP